jgi:hypothetical protein
MISEQEIKIFARLRAHEILIQDLLCHEFEHDPSALRDHAARMYARLDIGKLPGLSREEQACMSYETQESIARIVEETACRTEERRIR